MANVRNLYKDATGQRWSFNGYDWVKVGNDFDPRKSPFVAGVQGAGRDIASGVQQLYYGMTGDDTALAELARDVRQQRTEQAIQARQNPLGYMAGTILPYAGAAAAGGAAGGAAFGTGLGAGVGATAADMALAGLSYGTPGERAGNALMGAAGAGVGAGIGIGARRLMQGTRGATAQRVQQQIEGGPGAGGRATGIQDPQQVSLAAQIAGRMLNVGRLDVDVQRLNQTRRARALADQYGIQLTPAMRTGSRGMEQIEAGLMSNPWSRAPGERIRNAYLERLETETKEFLLPGYDGPVDEDFMRAVTDDINKGYSDIAGVSQAVDTESIRRRAQEISALDQDTIWTSKEHKVFNDLLNNIMAQGEQVQGGQAWNLQQQYAEAAARRFKAGRYEEGTAFQAVADAIEESLIDAASGKIDRADLNLLRKRYRVKLALESGTGISGREGVKLATGYNALKRAFPRELGEGRGFPEPELAQLNRMFDIWSIGNRLFRPIVGDSGTATRLAVSDMTPQGMGANAIRGLAASMYYNEPTLALRPGIGAGALAGGATLTGGAILD